MKPPTPGLERLTLRACEARTVARLVDAPRTVLDGAAWLGSADPRSRMPTLAAVADGNRGAIVADQDVEHDGRRWHLAVKGIGARSPLYGDTPAGYTHSHELDGTLGESDRSLLHAITRESWMGEGAGIE